MTQVSDHLGTVTIGQEDPAQPDIVRLLRNGEANSARLYPPESSHHVSLALLQRSGVRFLVARDADGGALATGAVVLHGEWAEIKRMWVEEAARRRGLAWRVLDALTSTARKAGVEVLRLETGVLNHAALALYEKAGFRRRTPFASYRHDPLNVFMEKYI